MRKLLGSFEIMRASFFICGGGGGAELQAPYIVLTTVYIYVN